MDIPQRAQVHPVLPVRGVVQVGAALTTVEVTVELGLLDRVPAVLVARHI
jgi:hypothetical protein